jgi:proline iminopeptidase
MSRFFPEAWERFRAGASTEDDDLIAGYVRQMADPDPEIRRQAADAWCAWGDTVISEEPNGVADVYSGRERKKKHSFVRIAAHYFAHKAWLEDGVLLRNADGLAGIPGTLIHGRLDLASPLETVWKLHCWWPDSELIIVDDAGHTGSETMTAQKVGALDKFADSKR